MRNKDYLELAKRSLRENKKSFSSSILGMAMGFIILIPLIVVVFAVNVNMGDSLNKLPYALYAETSMADYREESATEEIDGKLNLSGKENIGHFFDDKNIEDVIVYSKHGYRGETEFVLGDGELRRLNYSDSGFTENYYVVTDSMSTDFFPKNLTENYPDGIFVDGIGEGFTGNGKGQVIVSENFLLRNGFRAEDAAGKTLTVKVKEEMNLAEVGRQVVDGYICYNYTVAAVIKSAVSDMYLCEYNHATFLSYMNADLYFTDASVFSGGVGMLRPSVIEDSGGKALYYEFFEDKEALNKEYMMLGWGLTTNNSIDSYFSYNIKTPFATYVYFESKNYKNLSKAVLSSNKIYPANRSGNGLSFDTKTSAAFTNYKSAYEMVNLFFLIGGTIGCVIALCAVINLFCSVKHNVSSRKYFLTVLRAIGAKDSVVPKIYMLEGTIVTGKACALSVTVGFIISIALKYALESSLKSVSAAFSLVVPWGVIIVCVLASAALLFVLGIFFAWICTVKLSRAPIVDILKDNG